MDFREFYLGIELDALQGSQDALVDANVLLLRLHHPDALAAHLVDDSEHVDVVLRFPRQKVRSSSESSNGPRRVMARLYTWLSMDWSSRSRAMKVPERPTPALQWTTIGLWSVETRSRKQRTKRISVVGGSGTPKSGHVVKWKCRMMRDDSPRHTRNSLIDQSA